MNTTIKIKGTHCTSCKTLIEDVCRDIEGVTSCSVDFATGHTEIEHEVTLDWNDLKQAIESLGHYTVELP